MNYFRSRLSLMSECMNANIYIKCREILEVKPDFKGQWNVKLRNGFCTTRYLNAYLLEVRLSYSLEEVKLCSIIRLARIGQVG